MAFADGYSKLQETDVVICRGILDDRALPRIAILIGLLLPAQALADVPGPAPAGVIEDGPNRFRIFPSWRSSPGISEEAVGRSTRLGFKVVNPGPAPASVDLWIDWQYDQAPAKDRPSFASVEEFMSYRDFVVAWDPGQDKWRTVMADVTGSVAHVRLDAPPGETEVTLASAVQLRPGRTLRGVAPRESPGEGGEEVKKLTEHAR